MPQALRIAIPPMTSWHLNTIKNSSLGVAIGYPEFVSVVDTVISQTGQAIEGVGLIVATFLLLSLSLSFVTSRYARQLGWSVAGQPGRSIQRSEEHTAELQSLMRISYAVFCLPKKTGPIKNMKTKHQYNNI